jgi:hypothetical protein
MRIRKKKYRRTSSVYRRVELRREDVEMLYIRVPEVTKEARWKPKEVSHGA